jgi:hypothetical protein
LFLLGGNLHNWGSLTFRPGTTLEWSLKMVELLSGKGKRDEVAGAMVLHPAIA